MDAFEVSTIETLNNNSETFVDNRVQLVCDPKQLETWEIMVMETGKVNDAMLIFAKYLYRGETAVSQNLPNDPIDELSKEQIQQIKDSKAFKMLKRFKLPQLQAAIRSFVAQSNAGF